jgi:hypothetical protein
MKVSLCTPGHGTRKYKKHDPKRPYPPAGSIFALRYGRTFETIEANRLSEATTIRIRRQMEIDGGWPKRGTLNS